MTTPQYHYLIVGSGPTAAAAAIALHERGERGLVLDVGLRLEEDLRRARDHLASGSPKDWKQEDLDAVRYTAAEGQSLAIKRLFGSDLAFRDDGSSGINRHEGIGAIDSHAYGGLSTVWGAGLLTYTENDIPDWPISHQELENHARRVISWLPYSAANDQLSDLYPILRTPDGLLERSEVARALFERLNARSSVLSSHGYKFGGARLAVRTGKPAPAKGCIYCARCLDGCPYGHIYSADQTIDELIGRGAIDYASDTFVERVEDDETGATVYARQLSSGEPIRYRVKRVFIAAGALGTTAILQRSKLLPSRVEILDSQTLYVPLVWTGRSRHLSEAAIYTLSQLFLVIDDEKISRHPIHASLYTYNDSLLERARHIHPTLTGLLGPVLDRLAHRLVIAICFLHSDDSGKMTSQVNDNGSIIDLTSASTASRAVVTRFQRSLFRTLGRVGLVPLTKLSELAGVGGGYHYGGSMPMRLSPTIGESDVLGRPFNTRHIHAVDATCFPSIPGSTITLPAMANAHRIVDQSLDSDL